MDKGAKIIILEDKKAARDFADQHILKKNLRIKLLEKRAELVEEELETILLQLEKED